MRTHYSIAIPTLPGSIFLMIDHCNGDKHREITVEDAKQAVYNAVLLGHHVSIERNPSFMVRVLINVTDKATMSRDAQAS